MSAGSRSKVFSTGTVHHIVIAPSVGTLDFVIDMKIVQILLSSFLVLILSTDIGRCQSSCSFAELYCANVVGRIPAAVDIVESHVQKGCLQDPLISKRYRQMDGTCNHRRDHGATFQPVKRFLAPHYQDKYGIDKPRIYSVTGSPLPSPRLVSRRIHPDRPRPSSVSLMVMQMGQLLDHDITSAPVPTERNSSIKCCGVPESLRHPECFPIDVPPGDPRFKDCMEFLRSDYAKDRHGFKIYPREQMNALSSFVDGSAFYGSDLKTVQKLRTEQGKGALLRTRLVRGRERLPKDTKSDCLSQNHPTSYCQLAGDERVNELPGLSCVHLIFHLEHNNIVRQLVRGVLRKRRRPSTARDVEHFIRRESYSVKEQLFQEARKILSAIFQKVIYCDWLPIVVGPKLIRKFRLECDRSCAYKPSVDPRVANVFLTAAFRFGHTMIPNTMRINASTSNNLKELFMVPDTALLYHESIAKGLMEDRSLAFDRFVSKSISSHLFETREGPSGALDLIALNIQRGRDHGIPSYYHWRKHYKLRKYVTADDMFGSFMGKQMMKIYKHILDIDLFTAGILEPSVPGGVVGETFGHIIANQFRDLKYGDAHFFQCRGMPQGFTRAQLAAIKAASFAKIVCTNSDMHQIQRNPFRMKGPRNPLVRCADLPAFKVSPWMPFL